MRFALLGKHADGLEMACALVESGRHEVIAYTAPAVPPEYLSRLGPAARAVGDPEEVLADPNVEAVLVAGNADSRPVQLRRALQSERHVLCVYPPDQFPDIGYEAAMIQQDTGLVLFPLLAEALHPGIVRLARLAADPAGPLGWTRLVAMERWQERDFLIGDGKAGRKPALPGWDALRALQGEIAEVSGFATDEELTAGMALLLAGRYEGGGLFRASLLPDRPEPRLLFALVGERGQAELLFPLGWPGPAYLSWRDPSGEPREEYWDIWDPWPALVQAFESSLAGGAAMDSGRAPQWQDVVRGLELDDAVRRSVQRRRASALEYPEPTEETGFKGTMTLVGCALLWAILGLLILSVWWPRLGWIVAPVLLIFLVLQFLRWIIPRTPAGSGGAADQARPGRDRSPGKA